MPRFLPITYNLKLSGGRNIGKKPKKFQYTYEDIADILDLRTDTVRRYAKQGKFNPESLLSVSKFLNERGLL